MAIRHFALLPSEHLASTAEKDAQTRLSDVKASSLLVEDQWILVVETQSTTRDEEIETALTEIAATFGGEYDGAESDLT